MSKRRITIPDRDVDSNGTSSFIEDIDELAAQGGKADEGTRFYQIDYSKIKNLSDVIRVLKCLQITMTDDYEGLGEVKDLVKELKD
jgi:hypothetical protein